jgi:hypothetical protein
LLKRQNSGLHAPDINHTLHKHSAEDEKPSSWIPIISDELGGDESLVGTEVQRLSKAGKMLKYTVTRLDRDSRGRRIFIVTNDDLDDVIFSEDAMRKIVLDTHTDVRTSPSSATVL